MTEIQAKKDVPVEKVVSMHAHVIAGPETAARLGIPVGSVVEERHVEIPEAEEE